MITFQITTTPYDVGCFRIQAGSAVRPEMYEYTLAICYRRWRGISICIADFLRIVHLKDFAIVNDLSRNSVDANGIQLRSVNV